MNVLKSVADEKTAGIVAKVHALLNPSNVVIVGATDKPGNWAERAWSNLRRYRIRRRHLSDQSEPHHGVGHALLSFLRRASRKARPSPRRRPGEIRRGCLARRGAGRRAQCHRDEFRFQRGARCRKVKRSVPN